MASAQGLGAAPCSRHSAWPSAAPNGPEWTWPLPQPCPPPGHWLGLARRAPAEGQVGLCAPLCGLPGCSSLPAPFPQTGPCHPQPPAVPGPSSHLLPQVGAPPHALRGNGKNVSGRGAPRLHKHRPGPPGATCVALRRHRAPCTEETPGEEKRKPGLGFLIWRMGTTVPPHHRLAGG